VTLGTIERKMLDLQRRKGALAAGLLDPEAGGPLDITGEDVERLLAEGRAEAAGCHARGALGRRRASGRRVSGFRRGADGQLRAAAFASPHSLSRRRSRPQLNR
jgi:hypothetical protein